MIDVGLIGFGLAGRAFHAQVISRTPGMRLAAILQRKGDEAGLAYPHARIVRDLDELLALPNIMLTVIATPNETHFDLAMRCLAAGRDVLVDKPFTTTLEEAVALAQFAKDHRRLLTVYQNRRYDGDFQAIREVVGSGALGRIVSFESNYDRFRPQLKPGAWREKSGPGSGIFFDIAPHLIDHALVLFGLPKSITADIRIEREQAVVPDAFDVFFNYRNGLRAALRSSILAAAPRPRFVVLGTRGSYLKQTVDPQEMNLRLGRIPEGTPWGAEPEENWGVLTTPAGDRFIQTHIPPKNCDYRDFYANLRDAILGKTDLAVSPAWALDVMRILELCEESSRRRCTVPLE